MQISGERDRRYKGRLNWIVPISLVLALYFGIEYVRIEVGFEFASVIALIIFILICFRLRQISWR